MFMQNQSPMIDIHARGPCRPRATRLSACLVAALTVGMPTGASLATSPHGSGPVIVVENCNTGGAGSLKAAVFGAPEDSTIDLTNLTCSTITLGDGSVSSDAVSVTQDDLSIVGPGAEQLAITGGISFGYPNGRVFDHSGAGTLHIEGLTIADGEYTDSYDSPPLGGCIYSEGSVYLGHSRVTGCLVSGSGEYVAGGGVFAKGNIFTKYSTIDHNVAYNETNGDDRVSGGGLYAIGGARVKYSTIAENRADGPGSANANKYAGTGGGLFAFGDVTILSSTISDNHAKTGAGAYLRDFGNTTVDIRSSTISGNFASGQVGGLFVNGGRLSMSNSTVAFNLATSSFINDHFAFAGVHVRFADADVQSSIIANNYAPAVFNRANSDFSSYGDASSITGADNLIITSTHGVGTVTSDDPQLMPLAFNGGPTKTHALAADSPAFSIGNNATGVCCDQRGLPRVVGGGPDIGAFEKQSDLDGERIFSDDFDPPEV